MKYLLLVLLVSFLSCEKEDEIIKGPHFGKCVSNEEALALGVEKKCSAPGCVCIEDIHGKEHRAEPHCHSAPEKCD